MNGESSQAARDDAGALAERVAALRTSGAWRADPARFRFIEALSRRMPAQHEAVRRVLASRLEKALHEFAPPSDHADPAPGGATRASPAPASATASALAALNAYIRQTTAARSGPSAPGESTDPDELPNARRFREAWEKHRTLDQLDLAVARAPANAGPLNSHALLLRALAVMRDLSPDYLRRFLVYAEALQWLERSREQSPREQAAAAKPARRARRKK